MVPFSELPASATLWIFGAANPFTPPEAQLLHERMPPYLHAWAAHGEDVRAGWELKYNRFILIGINESVTGLTGCSQDSMRENIRQFAREIRKDIILGSSHIFYRDAQNEIICIPRHEFKKLAEARSITENTTVFDNTIENIGKFRQGSWELPLGKSWHAKDFGIMESVA